MDKEVKEYVRARIDRLCGRLPDGPELPPPPSNVVELCHEFSREVSRALRELLESKHLYQRVKVSYENMTGANKDAAGFRAIAEFSWEPRSSSWDPHDADDINELCFKVSHVKLYCGVCDSPEAFNPVGGDGAAVIVRQGRSPWRLQAEEITDRGVVQTFAFPFQCQACKGAPEVLLVRREGLQLILSGRSPMETVPVPSGIPKDVRRFFGGALLAHQSGQTLAGNFMLRTLIEQFARNATAASSGMKADEVLELYLTKLPSDFKERFPSFKALYGELSSDIHGAVGDDGLFERVRQAIIKHFEARRLFEL